MNLRQSYLSQNCRCFSKLVEMLTFIIDKLEATFGAEKTAINPVFCERKGQEGDLSLLHGHCA